MSAKKTGGTAGRVRERNSRMAANMKALGIKRSTLRCAICNGLVAIDRYPHHILGCKGRR